MVRATSPKVKFSPALWDEQLHLWTRNGTSLPSLKPSIQNSKVDHVLEEDLRPLSCNANEPSRLGNTNNAENSISNVHFVTMSTSVESFCHVNIAIAPGRAWLSSTGHVTNCQVKDSQERLNSSLTGSLDWTGDETTDAHDTQGFHGIELRSQSDSNTGMSGRPRQGDNQDGFSRNVRQRVEEPVDQNLIANDLDNYDRFEPGDNLPAWFPQPGDIIVHNSSRPGDHLSPGGHVTLYKDEEFFAITGDARIWRQFQFPLENGDFVVRLGKFTEDWKYRPSSRIETFLFDLTNPPYFWLVARNYNNQLQPPEYQYDHVRAPLNTLARNFRPRQGDLVVSIVGGEHRWGLCWWHHNFNFNPGDLLLRVGYEVRPNGTCMVVELYFREQNDQDWTFRGRDVWTYLNRDFDLERNLHRDLRIAEHGPQQMETS